MPVFSPLSMYYPIELKTGILPSLLNTLSIHGSLTQQANDSDVTYAALAHLLRIQNELNSLSTCMQEGELPESAQACGRIQRLVAEAPSPLDRADIMCDIKVGFPFLTRRPGHSEPPLLENISHITRSYSRAAG